MVRNKHPLSAIRFLKIFHPGHSYSTPIPRLLITEKFLHETFDSF